MWVSGVDDKEYPLGGALGGGDAAMRATSRGCLWVFEAADGGYYFGLHYYVGMGFRSARGYLLAETSTIWTWPFLV